MKLREKQGDSLVYDNFTRQVYPYSVVNKHGHEQYIVDPCQKLKKNVFKQFLMNEKYSGLCGALTWQSNIAKLGK